MVGDDLATQNSKIDFLLGETKSGDRIVSLF